MNIKILLKETVEHISNNSSANIGSIGCSIILQTVADGIENAIKVRNGESTIKEAIVKTTEGIPTSIVSCATGNLAGTAVKTLLKATPLAISAPVADYAVSLITSKLTSDVQKRAKEQVQNAISKIAKEKTSTTICA